MTRKFSKSIICLVAVLCMFCSSVTVFAENGDVDFDFNIQPIEPTTQEQIVETEKETERETEKETEAETKKPVEKTTRPQTTKAPDNVNNNTNSNNGNNANETTSLTPFPINTSSGSMFLIPFDF